MVVCMPLGCQPKNTSSLRTVRSAILCRDQRIPHSNRYLVVLCPRAPCRACAPIHPQLSRPPIPSSPPASQMPAVGTIAIPYHQLLRNGECSIYVDRPANAGTWRVKFVFHHGNEHKLTLHLQSPAPCYTFADVFADT